MKKTIALLSILTVFNFFVPIQFAHAAITYATWNPSDKDAKVILSNGNLTATVDTSQVAIWSNVRSTISENTGKWYWEITYSNNTAGDGAANMGIGNASMSLSNNDNNGIGGVGANGLSYYPTGSGIFHYWFNNAQTVYGSATNNQATIGVAWDAGAGTVHFYPNCTDAGSISLSPNIAAGTTLFAAWSGNKDSGTVGSGSGSIPVITANFGATAFVCTVPSGYNAGLYTGSAAPAASFSFWQLFDY